MESSDEMNLCSLGLSQSEFWKDVPDDILFELQSGLEYGFFRYFFFFFFVLLYFRIFLLLLADSSKTSSLCTKELAAIFRILDGLPNGHGAKQLDSVEFARGKNQAQRELKCTYINGHGFERKHTGIYQKRARSVRDYFDLAIFSFLFFPSPSSSL